jgi:FkbM family methyltransferase
MRSPAEKFRDYWAGLGPVLDRWKGFTFSQYAEDVVLNCSLLPKRQGFYIDVGAYHPWKQSNTYRFYLTGWCGITIEPNPDIAAEFKRFRPRDTHLVMGVSPTPGVLTYYQYKDAKINSFDESQSWRMSSPPIGQKAVECLPLREIIARHANGTPIDLLSIDCEGLDLEVLESIDFAITRPSVIVVEDFEQFGATHQGGTSKIRAFLHDQGYATFAQSAFSFHYLDVRALGRKNGDTGFSLEKSQYGGLARKQQA